MDGIHDRRLFLA